jgi:alpha-tubulin suppressor-like RCC1 family protein
MKSSWHGTSMTTIAAANPQSGFSGVAPDAYVLPIRVLGRCKQGYASDVADAIVWAVGAKINGMHTNQYPVSTVMMSFAGVGACPDFLQSAVNTALAQPGVVLYAAAGNDALPAAQHFPANCVGVISVGALDRQGVLAPYSGTGATVNQPGGTGTDPVPCIAPDGTVTGCVGTSAAVAYASGIRARVDDNTHHNYSMQVAWDISLYNVTQEMVTAAATTCPLGTFPKAVGAVSIHTGGYTACAMYVDGSGKCWGYVPLNGNSLSNPLPDPFTSGKAPKQIAISGHTCAIFSDDQLYCYGYNLHGPLGSGDNTNLYAVPTAPVNVGAGLTAVAVAVGYVHTCAILSDGGTKCWGQGSSGQLGFVAGTVNLAPINPIDFGGGLTAVRISCGYVHTCAILSDGTARCWGGNANGQLGDGTTTNSPNPVVVSSLGLSVMSISCGWYHTCAILSDGSIVCWGMNTQGQLGDNTLDSKSIPTSISLDGGETAVKVSAGLDHTCAILSDGTIQCWGFNQYGQVGDKTLITRMVPTKVFPFGTGLSNVERTALDLSVSSSSSCAILSDKMVSCWGRGSSGQLGDDTKISKNVPTIVAIDHSVVPLAIKWIDSGKSPYLFMPCIFFFIAKCPF